MKAEDTVMNSTAIRKVLEASPDKIAGDAMLEAQAKISFRLGEQESDKKWRQILRDSMTMAKLAGKREVVELT